MHWQAKALRCLHDFRDIGESVGTKGDDDFVGGGAPAHLFHELLKGIYRGVVDRQCLTRKVHVADHAAKGERPADQSVGCAAGEAICADNDNTTWVPEARMVINKKSKQSAHREAYTQQSHAAERTAGQEKVCVKTNVQNQSEQHGI